MAKCPKLGRLLQPIQIGQMNIKNRIVMSAMGTNFATADGYITQQMKDHYEERAKGGVGLIIVESTVVTSPSGKWRVNMPSLDDDRFIPGFNELVEIIHRYGVKALLQIHHGGPVCTSGIAGCQPVAASAIRRPQGYRLFPYELPRELKIEEIKDLVVCFARAAERAKKAGFDGVEIGAGHRYLINSFLSPRWNKRQDGYGGDINRRVRSLLEIIKAVRDLVGQSFQIWCKINGMEYGIEGGITLDQAKQIAQLIEKAGTDVIDVTAYPPAAPMLPVGHRVPLAEGIKRVVGVPVMVLGHVTPELGEKLLQSGKADLIGIARALIADPELPNKVALGRWDDIVPCITCDTCRASLLAPETKCTVNAAWGREREFQLKPAEKTKKVLIVGGGPAGMEAARVAALRGHKVILCESGHRLGGLLLLGSVLQESFEGLLKYLLAQIEKLPIEVKLGEAFTPVLIEDIKPDAVIIASGAKFPNLDVPGINRGNVISASVIRDMMMGHRQRARATGQGRCQRLMWYVGCVLLRYFGPSFVRRLLRLVMPFGKRIAILGGGLPSYELAEFLAEGKKVVTILDTQETKPPMQTPEVGPMPFLSQSLLDKLIKDGLSILTSVKYEKVTAEGLTITNKQGECQTIKADTIVLAGGMQPNTELFKALEDKVPEVYLIGDSAYPCGILEALHDGFRIARVV